MLVKPFRGQLPNRLHPLHRGCVGLWLFNEGTGGQVWNCQDPQHHGSIVGATWVSGAPGEKGGVLSFGGTNNYVTVPSTPQMIFGNGDFSVVARAYHNDVAVGYRGIASIGATNANEWMLYTTYSGSDQYFKGYAHEGAVSAGSVSDSLHSVKTWYTVSFIRRGTTAWLYIDGVLVSTDSSAAADLSSDKAFRIGGTDSGQWWNGLISWVRVYNRAISATENLILHRDPFADFG